jgi:hypothetical protein
MNRPTITSKDHAEHASPGSFGIDPLRSTFA